MGKSRKVVLTEGNKQENCTDRTVVFKLIAYDSQTTANIHQMNSIAGPKNTPSKLLSQDENEILFQILGNRCQTQCSAVVQVFATEGPTHSSWFKKYCGIVTFTKDSNRRSYFIQVYDIVKEQKLYEQELYNQFSYHVSMPFFHQFEGENSMIGLNFADNEEADAFSKTISDRQASKLRKKEERRRQQQVELNQNHQQLQHQQNQQRSLQPISSQSNLSISSQSLNKTKIKKGRRTNKLSKDQIGEPTNFQHITHVGFDQDKGITVNGEDEALHDFFKLAGVSDNLLKDDSTRKFIYDFIDQHGGVERAAEETKVYGSIKRTPSSSSTTTKPALPSRNSISGGAIPPQPPPRPQQPIHSHPQSAPPPPPPPKDRGIQDRTAAPQPPTPPPPSTLQPLAVAHSAAHPPPPPPPRIPSGMGGAHPPPRAPAPSSGSVPPPPPPPPIHGTQRPSIPAITPPNSLQDHNTRNDLLAQIRQRPSLTPVNLKKIEKPEIDSRTNLMSEIRKREYELKPVTPIEGDVSPGFAAPAENTMAAMLARALEGRAKAIQNESDTDEDDEEDEDEWDDT